MPKLFGENALERRNERTIKLLSMDPMLQTVREYPFDLADKTSMELMTVNYVMQWTRFI